MTARCHPVETGRSGASPLGRRRLRAGAETVALTGTTRRRWNQAAAASRRLNSDTSAPATSPSATPNPVLTPRDPLASARATPSDWAAYVTVDAYFCADTAWTTNPSVSTIAQIA